MTYMFFTKTGDECIIASTFATVYAASSFLGVEAFRCPIYMTYMYLITTGN